MRTTLSLDDDVAVLLEQVRKAQGLSLKQAVNAALRKGLQQLAAPNRRRRRHRTREVNAGRCLIGNVDDISEALAAGEGEMFR